MWSIWFVCIYTFSLLYIEFLYSYDEVKACLSQFKIHHIENGLCSPVDLFKFFMSVFTFLTLVDTFLFFYNTLPWNSIWASLIFKKLRCRDFSPSTNSDSPSETNHKPDIPGVCCFIHIWDAINVFALRRWQRKRRKW